MTQVRKWTVDVEVLLKISDEHAMLATVTNEAATDLDISPGRRVLAVLKAPSIRMVRSPPAAKSTINRFVGIVSQRIDAERNSEVRLDIGLSKRLTAVTPRVDVEKLNLQEGDRAAAAFDANQIILVAE